MKRQTQLKLASGVLLLFTIAVISETGFSRPGDNGNRWEYRFKKDSPTDKSPKTDNRGSVSAPVNLGSDGTACRDAFIMMSTIFDDTSAAAAKSRLAVPPLAHGESRNFKCTDPQPAMSNSKEQKVIGGTLTVQCINGVATLAAASCDLSAPPPPPPEPTPTPTPGLCTNCNTVVATNYTEVQISKNATGTRKTSTVYRCDGRAYLTKYESSGKTVCTPPSSQPGCGSTCDAIGFTSTSTYQISKNATGTRTSTTYQCDNGKVLVKGSSGTYCR
ncbi:hypothetical protein [Bdellovibrio sp. HCB288]|uniref:hypothetical protein n=1 Tax=Bdellovibrio sp. HCB288 TaxID=3394355 RepID=UPI0039B4097D